MISSKYIELLEILKDEKTYKEIFDAGIYARSHGYTILNKSVEAGLVVKDKKLLNDRVCYSLSVRGRVFLNSAKKLCEVG